MAETTTLSKKKQKELSEEELILQNKEMMEAIEEHKQAKKEGVKPRKLIF